MANQNETQLAVLFSSKDLDVSKSARANQLRFAQNRFQSNRVSSEKVENKQEFAKVYSQSLRNQTQAKENHSKTNTPKHPSPVKAAQPLNSKHKPGNVANQNGQNKETAETKTAAGGRKLPQSTREENDRRIDDAQAAMAAPVASNQSHNNAQQTQDPGAQTSSLELTGNIQAQDCSEGSSHALGTPADKANMVDAFDNITAADASLETQLSPQLSLQQATTPSTTSPMPAAYSVLNTGAAFSTQAAQNGYAVADQALPAGEVADAAELSRQEQNHQSAKSISPLDTLLRAAAEENSVKPPLSNMDKPKTEINKPGFSVLELFTNVNGAQSGESADGDDDNLLLKQEPTWFKDRLFALAQNNSANLNHGSPGDLNKILEQQITQLSQVTDDQSQNDFNISAVKDPAGPARLSAGPLQVSSPLLQMSSAPDQKAWSNEVGQRVMWMVNKDLQQAQLQLNPKHLGPLEIKITMTADQQINVHFLAHSTAVKEALDQALPRLRDAFDQSGLNLNNADVQQESHQQNHEQPHTTGHTLVTNSSLAENMHEDVQVAQIFSSQELSSNIVDFYA